MRDTNFWQWFAVAAALVATLPVRGDPAASSAPDLISSQFSAERRETRPANENPPPGETALPTDTEVELAKRLAILSNFLPQPDVAVNREEWVPKAMPPNRSLSGKTEWSFVSLSASVASHESGDGLENPTFGEGWHASEDWKVSVPGPFYVFGQVGTGYDSGRTTEFRMVSRTGLACKVSTGFFGEMVLQGGPRMTYEDSFHPDTAQKKSELLVEFQYRWPVFNLMNVEFSGSAIPALNPNEPDRISQDLRLAFPLGKAGKLRLGATRSWEYYGLSRPATESMGMFMGVALGQ